LNSTGLGVIGGDGSNLGYIMNAYWISKEGTVINVPMLHIDLVVNYSEKFGLTKQIIQNTFEKFNEPIGVEGKARHELMYNLIQKGWIRVRFTPKKSLWTIEINKLTKQSKNIIWDFFSNLDLRSQYDDVSIIEISKEIKYNKTNIKSILSFSDLFEGLMILTSNKKSITIEKYNPALDFFKRN